MKLNSLSAKCSKVNEGLIITIHEAFYIKIYIKLKPKECKITYPTLCILKLDSSVAKSAKISTILYHLVQIKKDIDRIAMVIWKYP